MTRVVLQKRIIRIIQPEIVQYTCDTCGAVCGTRENPKTTVHGPGGRASHYCRKPGHWYLHREVAQAGGWCEWMKVQVLRSLTADHTVQVRQ